MATRMGQELDIDRVDRANELRRVIASARELDRVAKHLLIAIPASCDVLIAFSNEGHAVASAASVRALDQGRVLDCQRASMHRPLAEGAYQDGWRWTSVEETLGFGPIRAWVVEWALARGGVQARGQDAATLRKVA